MRFSPTSVVFALSATAVVAAGSTYVITSRMMDTMYTREVNALGRAMTKIPTISRDTPPVDSIQAYEMEGLTVSAYTDSTIEFYSGTFGEHVLIVHRDTLGRRWVSRR
jgi:hypothetical protein